MTEKLISLDNYSIYKINNKGSYYICVPTMQVDNYQLFIGFSSKDLSSLSKEEVIAEIRNTNDVIQSVNSVAAFAIPEIPVAELEQAALENDDHKYNEILNQRIQPMTVDIYRLLIEASNNTKKMESTINVVTKNDNDKKFAGWLSMKLGESFIKEVDFDKLKEKAMKNDEERQLEVSEIESQEELVNNLDNEFSSGIAPINREYDNEPKLNKQNVLVRRLTKQNNTSHGFSSIKFIVVTLILSLVVGVSIGYLLIK